MEIQKLNTQELQFIRQLVGKQPHDQVNQLCVKIEALMEEAKKPAPEPPAAE